MIADPAANRHTYGRDLATGGPDAAGRGVAMGVHREGGQGADRGLLKQREPPVEVAAADVKMEDRVRDELSGMVER